MTDFTECEKLRSLNFELIGCQNRLKKIEGDYHKEVLDYSTYTLKRNKIVNHLIHLNVEINELYTAINPLGGSSTKKNQSNFMKKIAGIILGIALLLWFILFCFNKNISPLQGSQKEETQKRQCIITDFNIQHGDCMEETYAIIQIKNTGTKNLNDMTLKWTPDINVPNNYLVANIERLFINKTDSIKIPLQNGHQYKPGKYRSSLEEEHPASSFAKLFQSFELLACKKKALPAGLQVGDEVNISYLNQYKKTIRLIQTDSISVPVNCQNFKIKK